MTVTKSQQKFRADSVASDKAIGADLDAGRINGYVVCEEGRCKTPMRGEFDVQALMKIVELGNADPRGVRMRFQHPSMSDDGLGTYVARAKNFRIDKRDGRTIVRADAHMTETAMTTNPKGGEPLGSYLIKLAKTDPGGFQSSVVIEHDKLERKDDDGKRLPPLFRPKKLWASDFVDEGDAVHGDIFGSMDSLDEFFEGSNRKFASRFAVAGGQYLDQLFPDADREVISERFDAFKTRYLETRFGVSEPSETPEEEETIVETDVKEALDAQAKETADLKGKMEEGFSSIKDSIKELFAKDKQDRAIEEAQRNRASEIAALCKQAGYPDAEKLIDDESLSVGDAQSQLFNWKCKQNADLGVGGDTGEGDGKKSPIAKLRAAFDADVERFKKSGYTDRETWVKHQCRDKGIEYTAE